jgi:hypothetical protein
MKRMGLAVPAVLLAIVALVVVAGAPAKKKPALSATPVFKLNLRGSQEVPQNKDQKGSAVGSVTFDLTRSSAGAITSGDVIFSFNYSFASPSTVTGLHIHQAAKNATGPVVIGAVLSANDTADADGVGNITSVVTGTSPATLQAILDNPRAYYVNLHTPTHPNGALREQMHNPTKR